MFSTVPPMLVVKDLVSSRAALELHDVDRLHAGAFAGGGSSVNALDGHAFRKEIELAHAVDIG